VITRLDPNGDGFHTGFAASAGNKWACLDDGASQNDADYIYTIGLESYTATLTDLPDGAADISSLELTNRIKRDGGSYADGAFLWRSNGTTYETAHSAFGNSYVTRTMTRTVDPNGGGAWTFARVNALEVGFKGYGTFSAAPDFEADFCSWLKVDVTHEMAGGGGFACLVGSLVGGALGLAEMAKLARYLYRKTGSLITPAEYEAAWRDIRGHRWPRVYEVRG